MISEIIKKMIAFSDGNIRDIEHFMKVYAYAKTIGELEKLATEEQLLLEIAAVTHDIACPLCREKYGSTRWDMQEIEGARLVVDFLAGTGLTDEQIQEISWLVGHHHRTEDVRGQVHRILLEADYLVNAAEKKLDKEAVIKAKEQFFRTDSGTEILNSMFISAL